MNYGLMVVSSATEGMGAASKRSATASSYGAKIQPPRSGSVPIIKLLLNLIAWARAESWLKLSEIRAPIPWPYKVAQQRIHGVPNSGPDDCRRDNESGACSLPTAPLSPVR